MRVVPNYRRYEPAGGCRAPPESDIICGLCGYDIGPEEEMAFRLDQVCHLRCLEEWEDAGGGEERDGE